MRDLAKLRTGSVSDEIGMWFVGWKDVAAISIPPRGFDEPQPMRALE
jgi:hypothetical protein